MWKRRQVAALTACVAMLLLTLPPGQASADRRTARGHATAFAVFAMEEAPHVPGRWDPCRVIGYRVNRAQATSTERLQTLIVTKRGNRNLC